MDVFEEVFLGLFDQAENVAFKVVAIDDGRTLAAQKDRTPELQGGGAEEKPGRIEQLAVLDQLEFGQGVLMRIPGEPGAFHEAFYFVWVQVGQGKFAGLIVPAQGFPAFSGDQILQLADAQLTVFVRHPHESASIGEIGGIIAAELYFNAALAIDGDF
jgi:hypothetical protein